jgi:hypothetical protein
MQQFATLDALFDAICQDTSALVLQYEPEKLKAINNDIVSGWLGKAQDKALFGPVTDQSELVWRTFYLKQSIIEIKSAQEWANSIPIKRVALSKSEQLKFVWWVYLTKVSEFQERLFKFYLAARTRATRANQDRFATSKKAFANKFLKPIKPLIEIRNHWVHDSDPDFDQLKRLSSIELFQIAYSNKPEAIDLVILLRKMASKLASDEKKRLISTLQLHESEFNKLADLVVSYSSQYAKLYIPTDHSIKN